MTTDELHDELAKQFDLMYADGKIVNLEPFKAFALASYGDELKLAEGRGEKLNIDKLCRKRLHNLTKPPKD
jgi:hypothetical protein